MKIYFCEKNALEDRIRFRNKADGIDIKNLKSILESSSDDMSVDVPADSLSAQSPIDRGFGRYGTLNVDLDKSTMIGSIDIVGYLNSVGPDIIDWWLDIPVTGYNDILEAIDFLIGSGVQKIIFRIDSGGGEIGLVDNVWSRINSLSIETEAYCGGVCASAAYYIASACDRIVATNPLSLWGSIGVVAEGIDPTEYYNKIGIKIVSVTSENAEKKRLGFDSDKGIEEISKLVNQAERQFIGRISEGRNLDIEYIKEKFGRGGVMHAADYDSNNVEIFDALRVGMVDSVLGYKNNPIENTNGDISMNEDGRKKIEAEAIAKVNAENANKVAEAVTKANIDNVRKILGCKNYPKEVVDVGLGVTSGESSFDDFVAAIAEYDKTEISASIDEVVEDEVPVTTKTRKASDKPDYLIHDSDSATANAVDFKRR